MIVSDRRRFVFVHNPKCGGTVFRRQIEPHHDHPEHFWFIRENGYFGIEMDYAHLRLWEVRALFPDVFDRLERHRSIVFVRNPLRRFVSALHQHFRVYRPEDSIDEVSGQGRVGLFRRFIEDELTPARIIADYRFVHFSPQTWFCAVGDRRVVGSVIPMGDGANPMVGARNALELDLAFDEWRTETCSEQEGLLEDPALVSAAERLYARDHDFLASLPHVRCIL